ncbi:MAG: hypothetical protein IJ642_01605 [Oscillospiraceae bacterium]|nr:hypothetical protein [Oscillospiraceae bacterium]
MINTAILQSETLARKAQRILTANGYPSELVRFTSPKEGCRFGLKIIGKSEEIQDILRKADIPVRYFGNERDRL